MRVFEVRKSGVEVSFTDPQCWYQIGPIQGDYGPRWTTMEVGVRYPMGLGEIELRDTKKAGLHIVRFSMSGRFVYTLKLDQDGEYRLGSQFGHRVKTSREETDPITRVFRELEIPVSRLRLRKMTEGEGVLPDATSRACALWNAMPTNEHLSYWLTDGRWERGEVVSFKNFAHDPHCRQTHPTVSYDGSIVGATYAIQMRWELHMGGAIGRHIWAVVVWPGCDPDVLKAALIGAADENRGYQEIDQMAEDAWAEGAKQGFKRPRP